MTILRWQGYVVGPYATSREAMLLVVTLMRVHGLRQARWTIYPAF